MKKLRNILTVMFSHFPYEHTKTLYEWHFSKLNDFRIVWNIADLPEEEVKKNDDPNIVPMNLPMLKSKNFTQIIHNCFNWFPGNYTHYIMMEADSIILYEDFDQKCVEYMVQNEISLMMPWIRTPRMNKDHPFSQNLKLIESKMWAIPAISILTSDALAYYAYASKHAPGYWHEIRFPTVLNQGGFFVSFNPFLDPMSFHAPDDRTKSLIKEQIDNGILKYNAQALHPVKEIELLDYITHLINKKNG
jgi:hypothetical protein